MKAFLKNYRQSPRKVRLVASLLKGKSVDTAMIELDFLAKRSSMPIKKLLSSAIANAKANFNLDKENLIIKEIRVDKGIVMKRMMPAAMGTGHRINKRTSHVFILLEEKGKGKTKQDKKSKKEVEKKEKEVVEKKAKTVKVKKVSKK